MAYVFKSKAMQAQAAARAKQEESARTLLAQMGAQFVRIKQRVEELWGERGTNRAVRQSDFDAIKAMGKMKKQDGDYTTTALAAEIEELKSILVKIAGAKGPADR